MAILSGSGDGARPEILAKWDKLVGAWASLLVLTGVVYHVFPVLLPELMKAFDATEFAVSWLPSTFQLSRGAFTLPSGFVIHRFGSVPCIRVGVVLVLVACAFYPFSPSLWVLGGLHAVFGIAWSLNGTIAMIVFVTQSFDKQRALAIGIVLTGFTGAGFVFPPLVALAIQLSGWRVAAGICPLAVLLVVVPSAFLVIRDNPRVDERSAQCDPDLGGIVPPGVGVAAAETAAEEPLDVETHGGKVVARDLADVEAPGDTAAVEGAQDVEGQGRKQPPSSRCAIGAGGLGEADAQGARVGAKVTGGGVVPLAFPQMLQQSATWHVGFLGMYYYFVMIGVLNNFVFYLNQGAGLPLTLCSLYFSVACACNIVANVLVGYAFDTRARCVAGLCSSLLLIIGTILPFELPSFRLSTDPGRLMAYAVAYGLGWGAAFGSLASIPAKLFGSMPDFAKLQGLLALFQVAGAFLGTLVAGKLVTSTGGFEAAFGTFAAVAAAASLHALPLSLRVGRRSTP